MIGFILSPVGKLASAALFALLIFGLIYQAGKNSANVDQLKDTVKAHETRDKINAEVENSGIVQRCLDLGGLPDKCNKLRGLAETPESK
jgi:hypothetical protein